MNKSTRLIILTLLAAVTSHAAAATHPNILWLTAEDMSPHLGCYGDAEARSPQLDALARQSVRYTRAFATAPVCSPARSCLITGMYATSLGTQRLRSAFPVPSEFGPFTAHLRAAGYYCSNNVKTDYNLANEAAFIKAAWDESSPRAHWRGRPEGKPFFSVFNFMTTHQSRTSVWSHEEFENQIGSKLPPAKRHDPAKLTLPPFYPDTAEARRAWARYRDCISLMDREVGNILDQLSADGLADDTIVFFFSDHGMGMPRGKRCLQDSGMHVPLLIHFPEKWSHLAPDAPGTSIDRLVSFVDYAPTVLRLCGLTPPEHFQGTAFLGPNAGTPRQFIYGARDRVDEAFDVARSVRDDRWLYIRNFMPHLPWMQPEGYSDASTFRQELKRLAAYGELESGPLTFAAPRRAPEELYDTQADPHQLHNLATTPAHRAMLAMMRAELRGWQLATRDTGFLTEPQMWKRLADNQSTPWTVARNENSYPIELLLEAARAVGNDAPAQPQLAGLLATNDGVRYWAAVGLNARLNLDSADRETLRRALLDDSPVVRIEAAAALARHNEPLPALPVLITALNEETDVALHAARALELLGPIALPAHPAMRVALEAAREKEARGDILAMFLRFSLEAALNPRTSPQRHLP